VIDMKKEFILIALLSFTISFIGLVATQPVHATEDEWDICEITDCNPSIEPTVEPSVEPTVEVTPEVTQEPTVSPTVEVTPVVDVPRSDGRSDGLSSCPECTKAPVVPKAPPATGKGL
jgi:hypothetical protein